MALLTSSNDNDDVLGGFNTPVAETTLLKKLVAVVDSADDGRGNSIVKNEFVAESSRRKPETTQRQYVKEDDNQKISPFSLLDNDDLTNNNINDMTKTREAKIDVDYDDVRQRYSIQTPTTRLSSSDTTTMSMSNFDRLSPTCNSRRENFINYSTNFDVVNGSTNGKLDSSSSIEKNSNKKNGFVVDVVEKMANNGGICGSSALDVVRQMVGLENTNYNNNNHVRKKINSSYESGCGDDDDDGQISTNSSSLESLHTFEQNETNFCDESDEDDEECDFSYRVGSAGDTNGVGRPSKDEKTNNNKDNNDNLNKSLSVVVDETDFCCNSSLGSSTTCSDDSFELGTVEDFENQQRTSKRDTNVAAADAATADAWHRDNFYCPSTASAFNNGGASSSVDEVVDRLLLKENDFEKFGRKRNCLNGVAVRSDFVSNSSSSSSSKLVYDEIYSCRNVIENEPLSSSSTPISGGNFFVPNNVVVDDIESSTKSPLSSSSSKTFNSDNLSVNGAGSSGTKSRKSLVDDELSKLDTCLPQLDFDKLERQLADAAKEREMNQRQLMSETVRQRLAMDPAEPTCYPPAPTTRPMRSNFGTRLQTGMNLQICFMNDNVPSEEEEEDENDDDDDDDDDCWKGVPKSFSTPNLRVPCPKSKLCGLERSISNGGDSEKRASELRLAVQEQHANDEKDFDKRRVRLENETKMMLVKAKQAAHMQMELEKQSKIKRSVSSIEEIIGVTLGRRKLTRTQLTKMCITQLLIIINDLHSKIELHNEELVHLLIERDNLHMEQDSMLVDIEDLLQHQKTDDLKLPDFLVAAASTTPQQSGVAGGSSNNNGVVVDGCSKQNSKFRIFKR